MTLEQAGVLLDALHAAFPEVTISVETAQLYARFLEDIDIDRGAEVVATWIAFDGKRFPRISELRALAAPAMPDADQAWEEARRAAGSVGSYRSPSFSHPAIAEAVKAIGWMDICQTPIDQLGTLRAQFGRAYEAVKRRRIGAESKQLVAAIVQQLPQHALEGAARKKLAP